MLAGILATMMLTYALQNAAVERDDRKAASIAMYLTDNAEAFDHYQINYIARMGQLLNFFLTRQVIWMNTLTGPISPTGSNVLSSDVTLHPYRYLSWPGLRIAYITQPIPGEPQPLGIMLIDLDDKNLPLLPRIKAHLESQASTASKVWIDDLLPWLRTQSPTSFASYDYAFFTAPFADIDPEIQRRTRRAGWPDMPMATDLSFAPNLQICATLSFPSPGISNCGYLGKLEAKQIDTSPLVTSNLFVDSIQTGELLGQWTWMTVWPSPPSGAGVTANTLDTIDLNANVLSSANVSFEHLTTQRLTVSSAPPNGGFQYAASIGTLQTNTLRAPVLAASALASLPSTSGIPSASADFLERRLEGAQPNLSFGLLTVNTASATAAILQSLTVQERCTGCQ